VGKLSNTEKENILETLNRVLEKFPMRLPSPPEPKSSPSTKEFKRVSALPALTNDQIKKIVIEARQATARVVAKNIDKIMSTKSLAFYLQTEEALESEPEELQFFKTKEHEGRSYTTTIHFNDLDAHKIPIETLDSLTVDENPIVISLYARRRAILSLVTICVQLDPKLFYDNAELKGQWLGDASMDLKPFLKSLKIEPCLLQTEVGFDVLKTFNFLHSSSEAADLGRSLIPSRRKSKGNGGKTEAQRTKIALLLMSAFEPHISKVTDIELIEILSRHKFISALPTSRNSREYGLAIDSFGDLREQIFRKIPDDRRN
jgi:hypothetical protein